jgi:hypothetical protein
MNGLTVVELQALCKEKGIKGYSGKKKAELVALLTPPVEEVKVDPPTPLTEPEPKPKVKGRKKKEVDKPKVEVTVKKEKLEITKTKAKPKAKPKEPPKPKDLGTVPTFPHILGFEEETSILHQWLSNPPSVASLYGPTGIGKTFFVHEFFKTLDFKVIESPTDELPDILYTPSYISKKVVLMDDADKAPKLPNQPLLTHILLVSREKLSLGQNPNQLKVNKPSVTTLTKWLLKQYPKRTKEEIQEIIEDHEQDLRHILLTLDSGFTQAAKKDDTINRDAWHAASKLYNTDLSFDKRMAYAEIETDFVTHLIQDGIPKATFDLENAVHALDQLSTTDITRHTTGKLSMLVATVSKLDSKKPPFTPFPSWYGKYSKREKHKRFLNGKRLDLEGIGLLRQTIVDKANEFAEQGQTNEQIAKEVLKQLQLYHVTYEDIFEMYDDFLYEGSEVDEFTPELVKTIQKYIKIDSNKL